MYCTLLDGRMGFRCHFLNSAAVAHLRHGVGYYAVLMCMYTVYPLFLCPGLPILLLIHATHQAVQYSYNRNPEV